MVVIALKILAKYQGSQVDKGGNPYILHPMKIALQLDTEEERASALLHDVIEDSDCTYLILKEEGISESVIDIVKILTRRKDESYKNYLKRVKESNNKSAIKIKKLDLLDNLDTSRLKEVTQKDLDRCKKYTDAYRYLSE